MRIGVDIMGGDTPPEHLIEAVRQAASQCDASIIVYATPEAKLISNYDRITIKTCKRFIQPDEEPLKAIKTESTLSVAVTDLAEDRLDALVTVGNTGAFIADSILKLKKIATGIRPGLLAILPSKKGLLAVMDVGANLTCKAQQLFQFARLGSSYMKILYQIEDPAIGLLNIGTEAQKGHPQLQEAYELLSQSSMNFVGNIEGTTAFNGNIDVLITEGFAGNILLKTSEGTASFILGESAVEPRFNREEYPGALLIGLNRIAIKCHGNSSPIALSQGILGAAHYCKINLIPKLIKHFQE